MFAKVAFGLAVVLATASGAVAATKTQIAPSPHVQGAYSPTGGCARWFSWPCGLSREPDAHVRFELNRDWAATVRPLTSVSSPTPFFREERLR
jgi:hypothetical protein